MAKHDYLTEVSVNELCKWRSWVWQQEVPPLAQRIVVGAINRVLEECLKVPQPSFGEVFESVEEVQQVKQEIAEKDWSDMNKYMFMVMADKAEEDIRNR